MLKLGAGTHTVVLNCDEEVVAEDGCVITQVLLSEFTICTEPIDLTKHFSGYVVNNVEYIFVVEVI